MFGRIANGQFDFMFFGEDVGIGGIVIEYVKQALAIFNIQG